MDIAVVQRLSTAACELDAASEMVEAGSTEWVLIKGAVRAVEQLVTYEVGDSWPVASAPPKSPEEGARLFLADEVKQRLWALFDAGKELAGHPDNVDVWVRFHIALARVPEGQRP